MRDGVGEVQRTLRSPSSKVGPTTRRRVGGGVRCKAQAWACRRRWRRRCSCSHAHAHAHAMHAHAHAHAMHAHAHARVPDRATGRHDPRPHLRRSDGRQEAAARLGELLARHARVAGVYVIVAMTWHHHGTTMLLPRQHHAIITAPPRQASGGSRSLAQRMGLGMGLGLPGRDNNEAVLTREVVVASLVLDLDDDDAEAQPAACSLHPYASSLWPVASCLTPATRQPPHATRQPPHATRHTPHATRQPPHATPHPPTANRQPPTANRHTPPANCQPPPSPCPRQVHDIGPQDMTEWTMTPISPDLGDKYAERLARARSGSIRGPRSSGSGIYHERP